MSQHEWSAVDRYYEDLLVPADPALDAALRSAAEELGWREGSVSPTQGLLLHLLARACRARAILEIGTLGGYSTIWLARALPAGGRLVTLEADPEHARVARASVGRAGLAEVVEVVVGRALDTLPGLVGPFDLVFLDADKEHNPEYLRWALDLSRPGAVIVADNVVRGGSVLDEASDDPTVRGLRRFNELLAADPRVSATAIQTVGTKGWDGFAIAVVAEEPETR
ncbi:MAG TPA: O-methyltransferase [Terriglobales bacterium]|nr:O-methyltransferase [Terriglobales bacterium]